MSFPLRGVLVYGGGFLLLELLALFGVAPWPTLTGTIRDSIKWWHPIALMVSIFLFTLWGHFDRGWSAVWLIAIAVLIALAIVAHVLVP